LSEGETNKLRTDLSNTKIHHGGRKGGKEGNRITRSKARSALVMWKKKRKTSEKKSLGTSLRSTERKLERTAKSARREIV